MAPAVFDVGKLELSPKLHIFLCLLWFKVPLFTSTYPSLSPRPLSLIKEGGIYGGTRCNRSNLTSNSFFES